MSYAASLALDREKIRTLRKERGYTIQQAAERAGMKSGGQWSSIEAGTRRDPSFSTVQRIARALGVGIEELAADDDAGAAG